LPAAISAPTPISSLVHSSTLVTAGILLISKFIFVIRFKIIITIIIISLISIFFSRILACFEKDFKKIVAFSTLRQIGFILMSFSINFFYICFFHLFTHAYFKRILFFSVGNILHNINNNQDKRIYNKTIYTSFFNINILIVTMLSIRGFLFLSGFFRKEIVVENIIIKNNSIIYFFYIFSIILTILYSFKIFINIFILNNKRINKTEKSQSFIINIVISFFFSIFLRN
jgi:NADH-ubiquinone oxidoreductase chain 5